MFWYIERALVTSQMWRLPEMCMWYIKRMAFVMVVHIFRQIRLYHSILLLG